MLENFALVKGKINSPKFSNHHMKRIHQFLFRLIISKSKFKRKFLIKGSFFEK